MSPMVHDTKRTILYAALPALVLSACYILWLGHRRDYLGHYLAGYGGTLAALATALAVLPRRRFEPIGLLALAPLTLACIGAGAMAEATVFRIATFDEVDFCNQSLGAVLAGLAMLSSVHKNKPDTGLWIVILSMAAAFLAAGFYFAFT